MLDDFPRVPKESVDRYAVGVVTSVTADVVTVRVSDRRVHRLKSPIWLDQTAGTPAHAHGPVGPVAGDEVLLLVTGGSESDVWLVSWRHA